MRQSAGCAALCAMYLSPEIVGTFGQCRCDVVQFIASHLVAWHSVLSFVLSGNIAQLGDWLVVNPLAVLTAGAGAVPC